ncbi:hypothetical protein HDE_09952 [Halotydeus destructor]|nr:hypothetical protein HDE_09952 [Halotydeus destructor]
MEDPFEVNIERAFKRMRLSSSKAGAESEREIDKEPSRATSAYHESNHRNRQDKDLALVSTCSARKSSGNDNNQLTAQSRTRHASCPDRVESLEKNVTLNEVTIIRPLSPTILSIDPTDNLASRLCQGISSGTDIDTADSEFKEESMTGSASRGQKRHMVIQSASTSCSDQARLDSEMSVEELAGYFEEQVHIPRKMSFMAELMYT